MAVKNNEYLRQIAKEPEGTYKTNNQYLKIIAENGGGGGGSTGIVYPELTPAGSTVTNEILIGSYMGKPLYRACLKWQSATGMFPPPRDIREIIDDIVTIKGLAKFGNNKYIINGHGTNLLYWDNEYLSFRYVNSGNTSVVMDVLIIDYTKK